MTFLERFRRFAGTLPAPAPFLRWSALTCLSVAAMDRVWVELGGDRVVPNLYTFLIGPSGSGKGMATKLALRLLAETGGVQIHQGALTMQYLCDLLSGSKEPPKLWLVTEELSLEAGDKLLADRLFRLLTKLYDTSPFVEYVEGTRTHGRVAFKDYCCVWQAGTSKPWLRDCVSKSAVEGGFLARLSAVVVDALPERVAFPVRRDEELTALVAHLRLVQSLQGPLTVTTQAHDLYTSWFEQRPAPDDPVAQAVWARVPVHIWKLATLLALSETPVRMTIEGRHVTGARQLAEEALHHIPSIVEYVSATEETDAVHVARDVIQRAGSVHHAVVVRALTRRGVPLVRIREALDTLVQSGWVERDVRGGGRSLYIWKKRRWTDESETLGTASSDG